MRRILFGLFALVLWAAFTAPTYAADMKMSGFFRVRGAAVDNADGDDDKGDSTRYYDALFRPRFTVKTNDGKTMAVWEPEFASPNSGFAAGASRPTVGVDIWLIDFAVPGTELRLRMGRTVYGSPDGEIYDTSVRHFEPGFALYGKLSKNTSLSAFHTKMKEDTSDDNGDQSDYLVAVRMKFTPTLTLTPWAAKSVDEAEGSYDYNYFALNAKTKLGVVNVNASGVWQEGEVATGVDVSAWALLVRTSAGMGKLKLMGNITMLSGEKDMAIVDVTSRESGKIGATASRTTTEDAEYGGFITPQLGGSGWLYGGHIMSARRWMPLRNAIQDVTMGGRGAPYSVSVVENVNADGDGLGTLKAVNAGNVRKMNGTTTIEALAEYKVSKTLTIGGGLSYYQSAAAAPAVCLDGIQVDNSGFYSLIGGTVVAGCDAPDSAGDVQNDARIAYDDAKHFGTELNLGFKWKIYPNLELLGVAAYMKFGDYGLMEGAEGYDDMWALGWTLRHKF